MIKKLFASAALSVFASLAVACAVAPEEDLVDDPSSAIVEGEEEAVGTAESELFICGTACPSGYHPDQYLCSGSCGAGCIGYVNAANCEPNTGSSFFMCGTICPSGYHPTQYLCSSSCGGCSSYNNAATCEANTGSSFNTCGTVCPSGYAASSFFCSSSCGGCSTFNNAATCVKI
ncbi:hypothetical protein [Chondromyces crocatus]|uniref:TNFR-Cys domain-containing protein n=1 Tax=Chondromyces crocatus TaxID=52 RepID=A0A0K1EKE9_CHOCO|nr:hypothetical protein [Chondromyces crocatus]AKT41345.1 uncharacterized protein CMC5_055440 [Chondromyces crocatus]